MLSFLGLERKSAPRVATAEDFDQFFASRTAFVSQKSAILYCYARAGVNWDKLLREQQFAEAMEVCRWEAYAAVGSSLGLLFEGMLRDFAAGRELILAESMVEALRAVLYRHPPPAHDPEAWEREIADFRRRVGQAQQAAALPAHAYGRTAGARIFTVLPIHPRLRSHDSEMFENSVRFAFVNQHDEANRCFDRPAVAHALAGSRGGGHAPASSRTEAAAG